MSIAVVMIVVMMTRMFSMIVAVSVPVVTLVVPVAIATASLVAMVTAVVVAPVVVAIVPVVAISSLWLGLVRARRRWLVWLSSAVELLSRKIGLSFVRFRLPLCGTSVDECGFNVLNLKSRDKTGMGRTRVQVSLRAMTLGNTHFVCTNREPGFLKFFSAF